MLAAADSAEASPDCGDGFIFSHIRVFSRRAGKLLSPCSQKEHGVERGVQPDSGLWGEKEEARLWHQARHRLLSPGALVW